MAIEHLPNTATGEEIGAALARDGCTIVDQVVGSDVLDRVRDELAPWIDRTAYGRDEFSGYRTRRTGGLLARSATCRELVMHPLVVAGVQNVLKHATSFHLHLTQVIGVGPGEPGQQIHRDQWAFDFFPFPAGYEVQCNTIWALTDFTAANGATRVIPGSHQREDRLQFKHEDTEPAEMSAGSVLFYTGALYHGAGANSSKAVRTGINITYAVSWLRQEENQYLATPLEIARTFPEPLLRMMGYARGAYALGYVDDLRDPIDVLLGRTDQSTALGDLEEARERLRERVG